MLLSMTELITEASLSSHFVFCFCNIIIVFLLIDRAISSSFSSASNIDPLPVDLYSNAGESYESRLVLEDAIVEGSSMEGEQEIETKEEVVVEVFSVEGEEATGTLEAAEEENEEDKDDDEDLRKRIEEFIQKVNQAWQEETLKESSFIWQ